LVEIQFERLGYAARTATVIVQPDGTVEISASMSTSPIELEPIEVVVRSRVLERNGFYLRAAPGGTQFTRAEIEALNPSFTSELFRRVLEVRLDRGRVIGRVGGSGQPCVLTFFLNGMRMDDWDFDSIPPHWLEGMEIYQGVGATPVEYQGFRLDGGNICGVVLLWT
jgi:hypothetical protein